LSLPIPFRHGVHEGKAGPREDLAVFGPASGNTRPPRGRRPFAHLAARTEDGRGISIDDARRELHHIVVAGFIVWAWFVGAILELSKRPDLRDRLIAEIRANSPKGALTLETLGKMHELQAISMEIRRLSPVVYVFFGKARETFEFEGFTAPKGWAVLWGHRSSHIRPEIYSDPENFDPARFSPVRAEHRRHEYAYVPNGAGPHRSRVRITNAPLFLRSSLLSSTGPTTCARSPQDLISTGAAFRPSRKTAYARSRASKPS
jgi:hypothetical protein